MQWRKRRIEGKRKQGLTPVLENCQLNQRLKLASQLNKISLLYEWYQYWVVDAVIKWYIPRFDVSNGTWTLRKLCPSQDRLRHRKVYVCFERSEIFIVSVVPLSNHWHPLRRFPIACNDLQNPKCDYFHNFYVYINFIYYLCINFIFLDFIPIFIGLIEKDRNKINCK